MTINFHHGILCDEYEKQANAQGYTFGDRADFVQDVAFGLFAAAVHGCITESELDKIIRRFEKVLIKFLRPIEEPPKEDCYKMGKLYFESFVGGFTVGLSKTEAGNG